MSTPLLIAHRGFPFGAVENSEESFRLALEYGADILETDARLSVDGHLILSHDRDYSRFGGPPVPISECRRQELETYVLRDGEGRESRPLFLDDAIRIFPQAHFNVDLKDSGPAIVKAWVALLEGYADGNTQAGGSRRSNRSHSGRSVIDERCTTASFRDRTLSLYRRLRPGAAVSVGRFTVLRQLLSTAFGRPRSPRPGEGVMQLPEYAGRMRIVTPDRIAAWQKAGWKLQIWTIDEPDAMQRLANWGVDGIITNRADLFRGILESSRLEDGH